MDQWTFENLIRGVSKHLLPGLALETQDSFPGIVQTPNIMIRTRGGLVTSNLSIEKFMDVASSLRQAGNTYEEAVNELYELLKRETAVQMIFNK